LNAKGPNSFMSRLKIEKSVVLSKVAPLTKALRKFSLITGLRAEQSENRNDLALLNTIRNLK
jgi:3'-phosphoadenosine 5'-phosphosulfate sulfotransferase (PAPS reductase)/FAD synthetase